MLSTIFPPNNSSLSSPVLFFCAPPSNLSVSYYPHSYLSALTAPRLCSTDVCPSIFHQRFCFKNPSLSSSFETVLSSPLLARRIRIFVRAILLLVAPLPSSPPSKQPVLYSVRAVPLHSSLSSLSFPFH